MYGPLILAAFEEAGKKSGKSRKYPRAEYLAHYIEAQRLGETITPKTLVNYYDEARRNAEVELPLRAKIRDAFLKLLEIESFEEFKKSYKGGEGRWNLSWGRGNLKGSSFWVIGLVVGLVFLGLLLGRNWGDKMMVWKGDHYEEVALDLTKYNLNEIKALREDLIENFRKVTPDCNYEFFDAQGHEQLWYGKNRTGELEYFTALARHPETGKTLKAITPYMIRKYICPTY